jgi:hypothetical protein
MLLRRSNPAHHVFRCVRQHAAKHQARTNARERRADARFRPGNEPPVPKPIPPPTGGGNRNAIPLYKIGNVRVVHHFVTAMPQGPTAAALANAVADATGVRIRELPLTARRVKAAIGL